MRKSAGKSAMLRSKRSLAMMPEPPERILRINAVLDRTGLSRATLYRKIADGSFPKQIKLSTRCAGWRESAINAWLRNPIC